jgi:filamentous hemagglutinin family protein
LGNAFMPLYGCVARNWVTMKIKKYKKRRVFALLFGHWIAWHTSHTLAGPQGGQVVAGTGRISTSGATTTIQQSTPNLSLSWDKFNVTAQETVNFVQPSSSAVAVNRIFDANGSQIMGHINANGQVFLINPNGVLFGKDAVLNVGALVASTLDINDINVNSSTRAFSGSGAGQVINLGVITAASGGYVALLGNQVSNQGIITAQLGTVVMGAGSAVTLNFNGNSLVSIQVDQSVLNSLIENGGMISADGGRVALNAGARDSLLASVVNNTGHIEAHSMLNQDGVITLIGGMKAGTVNVAGTLDASAPVSGNGGFIETSAAHVKVANEAVVDTRSKTGQVGTWLVDPQDYNVAAVGGDISGSTLSTNLGTTSVTLQSIAGNASGSGNVNINDAVAWTANTTLTLTASNNVNVNSNIAATGNSAGLVINPNTSLGAEAASGSGAFKLGSGASITLSGAAPSLAIAGTHYVVINRLGDEGSTTGTDLQGMEGSLSGHFALGSNIDASATSTWNANAGFNPVGTTAPFTGVFDGLGHSVSQLTINRPATPNVGMFGTADQLAEIRHVGLIGGSLVGAAGTGSLLGTAVSATISDSYNTGSVKGNAGTGGLVGVITTGEISNSYNTGPVTGNAGTGGLVGVFTTGSISNSYSTNTVVGDAGTGGLVGVITTGNLSASYTTGDVAGAAGTGGLAGVMTTGNVSDVYTTGNVVGAAGTGGLVGGLTTGFIRNSFATGTVIGAADTGGLAGTSAPNSIISSFAVSTGGAIDFSSWNYSNVWTLSASGMPVLNALMKKVTITALSDSKTYDGLAYFGNRGASYAGVDLTYLTGTLVYGGLSQGAINAGTYAITTSGVTSTNAQYSVAYVNGSLTIAKAPLTLSAVSDTKIYDGNTNSTGTIQVSGLMGTDTLTGASQSFATKNVLGADVSSLKLNNGYVVQDGNSGSNYNLITNDAVGSINRLQTVAWVGGTTGNWFDPVNWAGGAVPDLANVANVTIPAGVNVSFNNSFALPAQGGAVHVDGITSSGALSLMAGTLNVATLLSSEILNQSGGVLNGTGSISVNSLNQTGGAIVSGGNLRVNQSFMQTIDGVIAVGGDVLIAQAVGDLEINHLSGQAIDVSALHGGIQLGVVSALGPLSIEAQGDITQIPSGNLSATNGGVIVSRTGDINLPNHSNDQDGLLTLAGRNITLSDISGPTVVLEATGNSTINSGGNLVVSGATNNLTTNTSNAGSTSFGATSVSGNLATNSAGSVSQTNAVTVVGTVTITTAAQDLTSIVADKALVDAAAAKVIADAAITKAIADAAVAAEAKALADAAAAKVIADAAIAKAIADAAPTKAISEVKSDNLLANVMLLRFKMAQTAYTNEDKEAAEKIIQAATDAELLAMATAAQVIIEAEQAKATLDANDLKIIDDAQILKVLTHSEKTRLMEETSAAMWQSRDPAAQREIADKAVDLDMSSAQFAARVIIEAERASKLRAQIAARKVVETAAKAKALAEAVANKVISDAMFLASGTNGATWKVIMAAKDAKVKIDFANAKIIANATESKRIVDEARIQEVADAAAAAKVIAVAAVDARSLSQALYGYLIERIASVAR